jgi:hypothetical protein
MPHLVGHLILLADLLGVTSGLRFSTRFHMNSAFAMSRVPIMRVWFSRLNTGHMAGVSWQTRRLGRRVLGTTHVPGHHLPAAMITALVHFGLDGLEVRLRFVVGDGRATCNVVDLDFLHTAQATQLLLDSSGAQRG